MVQKKYKICLVSDCLADGGAERVAASLSDFFVSKNIDIQHVIIQDDVKYAFSGTVFNLGKYKNKSNNILNKFKRFWIFKQFISENNFDYIIDFRVKNNFWQEFFVSKIIFKPKTIYAIHSFNLDLYFPKSKWLAQKIFEKKSIIAISETIKLEIEKKYDFKNIQVIYNPIDALKVQTLSKIPFKKEFDFIVAAGNMNDNKQFDKIIKCYVDSILPKNDIKLVLLGDGKNRNALEKLTKDLNFDDKIIFEGQVENPYLHFANAMFFIQASKFEGLPMVLIESLACGTPVVAFDCKSGPNEIIENKKNGLLIENQNFDKLTIAMNLMTDDKNLYKTCKSNSIKSIEKFEIENIGDQWLEFLNIKN